MDKEQTDKKKRERMNFVKETQDVSFPNLGTTFCKADPFIMRVIKRVAFHRGLVYFSTKTSNWLQNRGG